MSVISSNQFFMAFDRGEERKEDDTVLCFFNSRNLLFFPRMPNERIHLSCTETTLCLYKASWLTGWISGSCRRTADVCVIRMIHPHALYKRISLQVTGHLHDEGMQHRDQMVRPSSVTMKLRYWPSFALVIGETWLGIYDVSFFSLIFFPLFVV